MKPDQKKNKSLSVLSGPQLATKSSILVIRRRDPTEQEVRSEKNKNNCNTMYSASITLAYVDTRLD